LVSSWSINFLSIAMGSPIFFFPWPFTQFYLHPHPNRSRSNISAANRRQGQSACAQSGVPALAAVWGLLPNLVPSTRWSSRGFLWSGFDSLWLLNHMYAARRYQSNNR
jgi:hypothetical protein